MIKIPKLNQEGSFLGASLIIILVLTAIGISLSEVVVSRYSFTKRNVAVANSVLVAEAGVEKSIMQLNTDESFTGFASPQVFFDEEGQGRGEFTSTIESSPTGSSKVITTVGKVFAQANPDRAISERKIRVTIVGTESEGYSVQTGPGGLILTGSANITNSDVYVNGTITLSGAAKIGTYNQPLNVQVANQVCPSGNNPGPSYPEVCTVGEAIDFATSTKIYGDVCATNQTKIRVASWQTTPVIEGGSTGQGLISGCVAPPVPQPAIDRAGHIAKMTTTASGNDNNYVCQSWPFNRTWPADLQLNGNVSIGGSCNVVINGDVYITGDFNLGGAARMTVSDSVGTNQPKIMVDGKINVGGSGQLIANASGTGAHFISTKSNASCGSACTTLSGNELKHTQDFETINVGGAVNMAGMIFQAYWGKVKVGGSGNVGAAVGQTVDLSGAGTVTFGTKLSSGNKIWTVTSYQQIYD